MKKVIIITMVFLLCLGFSACGKGEITPVKGFSEGHALVKQGDKYGYIDTSGKVVIPIEFNAADSFKDGIAKVTIAEGKDEYQAYINTDGTVVFDYKDYSEKYGKILGFSEGLAGVATYREGSFDTKAGYYWGYIDISGNEIIPLQSEWECIETNSSESPSNFHDGIAFIKGTSGVTTINTNGILGTNIIVSFNHLRHSFRDGIAVLSCSLGQTTDVYDKYILVNDSCSVTAEFITYLSEDEITGVISTGSISEYSEGLIQYKAPAEKANHESGVFDKDGNLVFKTEAIFTEYSDGIAAATVTGEDNKEYYTYIDKQGKYVIEPQRRYKYSSFCEGYAWAIDMEADNKDGTITGYVIDRDFNIVSAPIILDNNNGFFNEISDGYTLIEQNESPCFVDIYGNILQITE